MERLRQTPSQTVGPFFAYSLTAEQYGYAYNSIMNHALVSEETPADYANAQRIILTGRVFDGEGKSIPDAIVELWQADPLGRYRAEPIELAPNPFGGPYFTGFGRVGTGTHPTHYYTFSTLKPGVISAGSAPHINVLLFMRGSLHCLRTRVYFSDEADANAHDGLLNDVPDERRATLIAHRRDQNGQVFYDFDIHLQGETETVFFAL